MTGKPQPAVYKRGDSDSGVTIRRAQTGYLVKFWSQVPGTLTDRRILVKYSEQYPPLAQQLPWDDIIQDAESLVEKGAACIVKHGKKFVRP